MGMNVGSSSGDEDEVVSSINTTPLVDVMLVLLIIFLITVPVVTQSVKINLPLERNEIRVTKPENIEIAITKEGDMYWATANVPDVDALVERLKKVAVLNPQPQVHIRADKDARYESVGRVVFACQRAGIMNIHFVTEPPALN
ncbi:MAG TPA: biopolymer transporter ExbD [Burkholderiaceae bacterium]|jgi:biopolymer transport protein ExbD